MLRLIYSVDIVDGIFYIYSEEWVSIRKNNKMPNDLNRKKLAELDFISILILKFIQNLLKNKFYNKF
jgi:hypothetical protein